MELTNTRNLENKNNTDNVRIRQHRGAFRKPLLLWKSNKHYMFVRVCVRACTRMYLAIHHEIRMRHVMTSFVAPLTSPHLSKLSHKRCDFRKKVIECKMCVLIFSRTLSKIFLILRRI